MNDFYAEDLAYIHDSGFTQVASEAAGLLVELLGRAGLQSGTVTDLGCGSGVLAHRLDAAGYSVRGVDISPAPIEIARRRVPRADFHVGSFVSCPLPSSVAVAAVGEVLSYAFDADNNRPARRDLFRRVFDALCPDGVFLFDMVGPEAGAAGAVCRVSGEGPDWAVLADLRIDAADSTLTRRITSFREVDGLYRRRTEAHRLWLVDPHEVRSSLESAGFRVRQRTAYGSGSLPPGVGVFVAEKPDRDEKDA